jgi:hypothetical protein
MAQYGTYEPAPEIPKRRMPWFTKLMFAFALLMVVLIVYGFVRARPAAAPDEQTGVSAPMEPVAAETDARHEQRAGWWSAASN